MFKISEFSKLSQVPVKTLRFYDQLDLLKPAYKDQQSGYLSLLYKRAIACPASDLGVEMRGMFRLKQAEVQSLIESEVNRLRRIEARLEQIERGGTPHHEILVKKVEPLRVVSVKETTSRANIPCLFEEIVLRPKCSRK